MAWWFSLLGAAIVLILLLHAAGLLPKWLTREFDPLRTRRLQSIGPTVPGWARLAVTGIVAAAAAATYLLDTEATSTIRRNGGSKLPVLFVALALLPFVGSARRRPSKT